MIATKRLALARRTVGSFSNTLAGAPNVRSRGSGVGRGAVQDAVLVKLCSAAKGRRLILNASIRATPTEHGTGCTQDH
jgi:hypothetical protein